MDKTFIEIIVAAAKIAPVVAVLWLVINYLVNEKKSYVKKIDELQDELRKNEKETLQLMNRLTNTLDMVLKSTDEDKKEIIEQIKLLHKDLSNKIKDLK